MTASNDLIIRNGTVFDGTGAPRTRRRRARIRDGRVVAIGPKLSADGAREIDASGKWVVPGFLDVHTHYDAELEVLPGLEESVRHGVTTVVVGNCSLSAAVGSADQLLDLFCRVESLPRPLLEKWLGGKVTWSTPRGLLPTTSSRCRSARTWRASSGTRASGSRRWARSARSRSAKGDPRPSWREDEGLCSSEALDAGLRRPVDRHAPVASGGTATRHKGMSVPSQQAGMPSEYSSARGRGARRRSGMLQATPNALKTETVARHLPALDERPRGKKALKTTIVAALDVKTDRTRLQARADRREAREPVTSAATCGSRRSRSRSRSTATARSARSSRSSPRASRRSARRTRSAGACSATRAVPRASSAASGGRTRRASSTRTSATCGSSRRRTRRWSASHSVQIAKEKGPPTRSTLFMDLMRDHDRAVRWKTVVANDQAPVHASGADGEPVHASRLQRLGRPQPQHGVPGRRAADARSRWRRTRRR
jgi:hypothetical protein